MRRLVSGQFYSTPFLGWKEFVPTYFGPIRTETVADQTITLTIPSMLNTMYDKPIDGTVAPQFMQNVKIERGVLLYAE